MAEIPRKTARSGDGHISSSHDPEPPIDLARFLTTRAECGRDISDHLNSLPVRERTQIAHRMEQHNRQDRQEDPNLPKLEIAFSRETDTGVEHLVGITKAAAPGSWETLSTWKRVEYLLGITKAGGPPEFSRITGCSAGKQDVYRLQLNDTDGRPMDKYRDPYRFDEIPDNTVLASPSTLQQRQQVRLKLDDDDHLYKMTEFEAGIQNSIKRWEQEVAKLSPQDRQAYKEELRKKDELWGVFTSDPIGTMKKQRDGVVSMFETPIFDRIYKTVYGRTPAEVQSGYKQSHYKPD